MNETIADVIARESLWLTEHEEIFRFVTVGGSVARNRNAPANDIDMFVHCRDVSLGLAKEILETEIPVHHSNFEMFGRPELVDGFGIRFGLFSRNSRDIDYFLVSPALVGDFESFSHHLLIHGDPKQFFEFVKKEYRRTSKELDTFVDISALAFRILHYCKRLIRSYYKEQFYETQRSALTLRAIAYGIKKNHQSGLSFDWFSCNMLDSGVQHAEFDDFLPQGELPWLDTIIRIVEHFIYIFDEGLSSENKITEAATQELKSLRDSIR
ncbi:hypothetical protein [Oceaniradius stylonematis]|uniref:hypothetical protein n=1 Tax=Oceaniradius stylonematis TaxID=2184161 RepID=UPI000D6DB02B|nr:hypothetical protein [Oceaniradius stylonematis]